MPRCALTLLALLTLGCHEPKSTLDPLTEPEPFDLIETICSPVYGPSYRDIFDLPRDVVDEAWGMIDDGINAGCWHRMFYVITVNGRPDDITRLGAWLRRAPRIELPNPEIAYMFWLTRSVRALNAIGVGVGLSDDPAYDAAGFALLSAAIDGELWRSSQRFDPPLSDGDVRRLGKAAVADLGHTADERARALLWQILADPTRPASYEYSVWCALEQLDAIAAAPSYRDYLLAHEHDHTIEPCSRPVRPGAR